MPKKGTKLNDQQKRFVVQRLACFDTPHEVVAAVREEFGISLEAPSVQYYDPTKRAGTNLSQKWKDLFFETREDFKRNVESYVPEANKMVRVRQLAHAARAFKGRGNYVGMADMMERIAKEIGGAFTNRREFTGKQGGPIEFADMSEEQLDARLGHMLQTMGMSAAGGNGDGADAGGSDNPSVH